MAPSKAERYHGQVKWHKARLYVTMGKSNGTKQGCTLPWVGKMTPSNAVRYHGQSNGIKQG